MIPEKWLSRPPTDIAAYLRTMTPAGKLLELPEVREALAQDAFVENVLMGYLYTPSFLEHEEQLISDWKTCRKPQYAVAMEHVALISEGYQGFASSYSPALPSVYWEMRQRLRLAACRKIDATAAGNEIFERHRMLAGQPGVTEKVGDLPLKVKLGTVVRATYGVAGSDPGVPALLRDIRAVSIVERLLLPFLPDDDNPKHWASRLTLWFDTTPMRAFEVSSRLLLLPQMADKPIIFAQGDVPAQYVERISRGPVEAVGVSFDEFARLGISPYLARPVAEYLQKHDDLVAFYRSDNIGEAFLVRQIERRRAA